jgi:hypothetical protein
MNYSRDNALSSQPRKPPSGLAVSRAGAAPQGRLSRRARGEVLVGGLVAEFRHEVVAFTLGDEAGDGRIGIAEVAEVAGVHRAGGDAGRLALLDGQVLVVDAVDAKRAFLHHAADDVELARAIGAGPGAQPAADAQILVDQHDAVLGALVGGAGGAHGDAVGLGAVQARAREVDGARSRAVVDLVAVDAVEPGARRVHAIGVDVGQRRGVAAGVPLLAAHHAGLAADAGVEVDDEAEAGGGRVVGQAGHRPSPVWLWN